MGETEAAWDELHDVKSDRWFVGPPTYIVERREWTLYGIDTRERAKAGHRTHDWTAVADSELGMVREMARCLREISEGRWPQ